MLAAQSSLHLLLTRGIERNERPTHAETLTTLMIFLELDQNTDRFLGAKQGQLYQQVVLQKQIVSNNFS